MTKYLLIILILAGVLWSIKDYDMDLLPTPTLQVEPTPDKHLIPKGAVLGGEIIEFKKKFPQMPSSSEIIYKYIYNDKFRMSFSSNYGIPEKAEAISINLKKLDINYNIVKPEICSIQLLEDVDLIIRSLIPKDSKLVRQKTFKDVNVPLPEVHYRTFREYESSFLDTTFTVNPYVEMSNKKTFQAIIDKTGLGYEKITLCISTVEWSEIDKNILGNKGWVELK